jgi:hypothetical protein
MENGIDLTRGSDLSRASYLPVWNPNQPLEHARSADDRSPKSVQKANAFVVSLIWVFWAAARNQENLTQADD